MKRVLILLFVAGLSMALTTGCGRNLDQENAKARLEKLIEIQNDVLVREQVFISLLDSINNLRDVVNEYHDSLHALSISKLSVSYDGYVQSLYDALGKTAALANSGTDLATDAMSTYLLGMKEVAEKKYSEMIKLTSLSLDSYGEREFSNYTYLLQEATMDRQRMEDDLNASFNSFAQEYKIELKPLMPSVE